MTRWTRKKRGQALGGGHKTTRLCFKTRWETSPKTIKGKGHTGKEEKGDGMVWEKTRYYIQNPVVKGETEFITVENGGLASGKAARKWGTQKFNLREVGQGPGSTRKKQ